MIKSFRRFGRGTRFTQSEAALRMYLAFVDFPGPYTAGQLQEAAGITNAYAKQILRACVRNQIFTKSKQDGEEVYDFTAQGYQQAKAWLQSLVIDPAAWTRAQHRYAPANRLGLRGPTPLRRY